MRSSAAVLSLISATLSAEPANLSPLVVTGDKPSKNSAPRTGHHSPVKSERIAAAPLTTGTYQDLFALVAGAYSGNSTAGTFSLRGLNQDQLFGFSGTSANPLIAVLEDGAPLSTASLRYLPPVVWNLENAEILRGPQSLTHGPNSLGGALLLDTAVPSFSWSGNAVTEVSEFATYRSGIAQDLVLLPDELALRLSYFHQESDGQATNTYRNDDRYGATSRDRFQARLLWYPAGNRDHLLDFSLVHDRAQGSPFATVNANTAGSLFDRETALNTPSSYPVHRTAATLNATFTLPDGHELKSTTALQSFRLAQSFDLDATPTFDWFVDGTTEELRFTEDLTLADREGKYHWLIGSYYEWSHYDVGFSGRGFSIFPSGNPFTNAAEETVEIAALYGRFDWEFAEKWHLTGGSRLHHEERALTATARRGNSPQVHSSGHTAQCDLLPQLGVAWQPDDRSALGITLARGHRGGGISYAPTLGVNQRYDAESSWDTELYTRLAPTAEVTLSGALFHSRMENQQVPVNAPGGFTGVDTFIENAASTQRYGAELEVKWQAHETLTLHSSFAYIHTEFTRLILDDTDRTGQAFPNAPEWLTSLGMNYQHPSGFFCSTLFSWAETTYSSVSSPEKTTLESRELLSARMGYAWGNTSLYLFGSNLLNDEYALLRVDNSASRRPISGKVAPPRLLGIGAEIRW